MSNEIKSYDVFCNDLLLNLYKLSALSKSIESMVDSHENGQSDQALIDIGLLARLTHELLGQTADVIDNSSHKYAHSH